MAAIRFEICPDTFVLKVSLERKQFCPVLNSPTDNEGEMGDNKTGANISLYAVFVGPGIQAVVMLLCVHAFVCITCSI